MKKFYPKKINQSGNCILSISHGLIRNIILFSFILILMLISPYSLNAQAGSYTVPSNIYSVAPAAGTAGSNYVKTITYQEAKTTPPSSSTAYRHIEEISYFDGLGRPVQTVSVGASPLKNDIIQAVLYDGFGREIYKPLPYAATDRTGNFRTGVTEATISSYYSNSSTAPLGVEPSGRAYTQIGYDNSPLNRVISQTGPGTAWASKPVVTNYLTNSASDVVTGWTVSGTTYTSFTYATGSLFVTEIVDEQGNKTREYKDKLGRVVQKSTLNGTIWQRTAYIYDDYNRLSCVVPPLATDPTQTNLCYYYSYDSRDRMIEKKIPGGGTVSMVYDKRDRLRCTQNSVQDAANEWSFIQYDELNRPVISGIIKNYDQTPAAVKTALDAITTLNESRNNTATYYGYNHLSYPTSTLTTEVQSVTFYDDYAFITPLSLGDSLTSAKYDATSYNIASIVDLTPTGRVTGTMTRVLASTQETYTVPDQLLYATTYYDKFGHVLRAISEDHLKGKDIVTNQYEAVTFLLQKSKQQHYKGGRTLTLEKTMEYDHVGRLVSTREKVNTQAEFTLNAFKYNEIGQVAIKYLHSHLITGSRPFTQKVDNQYNIRGWLTKINDPGLASENDLFGMQLCYETTSPLGSLNNSTGYFNGNIVGMKWGIKNDPSVAKGFVFSYDSLNRVKTSNYAEGATLNTKTGYFNENVTSYDKNGNIKMLNRKYDNTIVDNLTYTYTAGTNRIASISDAGTASALVDDYPGTSGTYAYDVNGNMTTDGSRGVTLEYISTLNLPKGADFGNNNRIFYHYSASGAKLLKHVKKQDGTQSYTNYIGNVIYEESKLSYVISDEGRFINTGTNASPVFAYEYNLKDHLGNNRVSFIALASNAYEITTKADYYPFGLVMAEYNNATYTENRYLYNGKEIQDDNLNGKFFGMLDYGARFYDPQIGRWHSVDPLGEFFDNYSLYAYALNNPLRFIDPNGMAITENDTSIIYTGQDAVNYYNYLQNKNKNKTKNAFIGVPEIVVGTKVVEESVWKLTASSALSMLSAFLLLQSDSREKELDEYYWPATAEKVMANLLSQGNLVAVKQYVEEYNKRNFDKIVFRYLNAKEGMFLGKTMLIRNTDQNLNIDRKYITPDIYTSRKEAKSLLALPYAPNMAVWTFESEIYQTKIPQSGWNMVQPANNEPGGGNEATINQKFPVKGAFILGQ